MRLAADDVLGRQPVTGQHQRRADEPQPVQTVELGHDLLGRLKKRIEPEGTSEWTWGTSATAKNIGQLSAMTGPGYSESYIYDGLGRMQTTTIVSDATYQIDYAYNTSGLLHTLTYPASTSSYRLQLLYEYQNGQLLSVKDANATATAFWTASATDARGNTIAETLGTPERVGYASELAFAKAFRRLIGTPPGAYAREHGRGDSPPVTDTLPSRGRA